MGAYGGRREIMEYLVPVGPVYQAGPLSGNPPTMVTGTSAFKQLKETGFYDQLNKKGDDHIHLQPYIGNLEALLLNLLLARKGKPFFTPFLRQA